MILFSPTMCLFLRGCINSTDLSAAPQDSLGWMRQLDVFMIHSYVDVPWTSTVLSFISHSIKAATFTSLLEMISLRFNNNYVLTVLPQGHCCTTTKAGFDLQIMSLCLLTNISFYFVWRALGNVVMAYFVTPGNSATCVPQGCFFPRQIGVLLLSWE